ncbi:MAG: amino acid adenylation domain-containing protein [Bacteroidota bacterium]
MQPRPPLSFAQQRLWFLERLEPGTAVYNIPRLYRLRGRLDVDALSRSIDGIVQRHEVLRTIVKEENGRPSQTLTATPNGLLRVVTAPGPSAEGRAQTAWELVREESGRPFDLATGPLIRGLLVRVANDEHLFLVTMHHIVSDGWSLGVFVRELGAFYADMLTGATPSLEPLPLQYGDYAHWQRERLRGDVLERQMHYWRNELGRELPVLELGTDRPRPAARRSRGGTYRFPLSRELMDGVKEMSRRHGCTPFMTLLAAYGVLLHRHSGQDDLLIGTPIAGRTRLETEGLIGLFVNTLALRVDCSGEPTFLDLLKRVRSNALGAYEHQEVPFEKLVEELHPARTLSRTPVFQTMFVLQNTPSPALELKGIEAEKLDVDTGTSKFDLTMSVTDKVDRADCLLEYDSDLFGTATMERMADHYRRLLNETIAGPERSIGALPMLSDVERHRILVEWNPTRPLSSPSCIHHRFENQAARLPEKTALLHNGVTLSYRELNERSNRLAHALLKLGAGPEIPVGVCLERTADLIVTLLAVLKSGSAYIPLDPSYPSGRIALMLDDAHAPLVVTEERLRASIPSLAAVKGRRNLCIDAEHENIASEPSENPRIPVKPGNMAYVIYTSGSTGIPKGVVIEHRNTGVLIDWAQETYSKEELDGVLASTSICFDLSVFEIFAPLCLGGTVILVDTVLQLPGLPSSGEVRLVNTVPSAMTELLRLKGIPPTVQTINLAGEPLTPALVRQVYALGTVTKVYDLYGPSEDTTYSTCALRTPGGPQTIGRPLMGKRLYVLDAHCEPVPVGVTGEIYVGGGGVARGYLYRPELTAENFVADPFSPEPDARVYRTGDLGRYRPDGTIEFLGRKDHQIKLRGFRIELGEIEAVIAAQKGVRETVVVLREDAPGSRRIVAYVVLHDGTATSGATIRDAARSVLPEYMVPSAVVVLSALPMLPNGKVDRVALPPPEAVLDPGRGDGSDAPRTATEQVIAEIWSSMLGLNSVGVRENFFDLGGHSLLATQVISRMREALRVEVPLIALFETPTVEGLASAVEGLIAGKPGTDGDGLRSPGDGVRDDDQ